ncbi:aspartate/glutamate racemase family protein [Kineococcus radiotolerans]|uniref:Asp/Glu racemase n=1 Tax=Kineococcus radiotolerans (strain ATCC BAA-149 / DSM 14245 / SRS30216) TaxID=266940 RepID=A6WAX4_KINRD|nr:aspartate/glutamate racemase family protein [Kineococcus radiotolerans]ABS03963.1 Asp/Glu racemase [Kineococcus radiotolerans SRS30216 = ATCC BAA-149]
MSPAQLPAQLPAGSAPRPLVALISATPASIPPVTAAFADAFPDAVLWNILDDRLLPEAEQRGGVTDELAQRMGRLIEHAVREGADAVLLTCSLYGPVTAALREAAPVPLLPPDGAAFDAVLRSGHRRILLVASNPASMNDSRRRLLQQAASEGLQVEVDAVVVPGAVRPALEGDQEALTEALYSALLPALAEHPDTGAVLLAQYSLAPAAPALASELGRRVYSSPQAAAELLHQQLTAGVR